MERKQENKRKGLKVLKKEDSTRKLFSFHSFKELNRIK